MHVLGAMGKTITIKVTHPQNVIIVSQEAKTSLSSHTTEIAQAPTDSEKKLEVFRAADGVENIKPHILDALLPNQA